MSTMTHAELFAEIQRLQAIQKVSPPRSIVWMNASADLAPLFAEMAKRQKANGGEPDHTKWSPQS